MTGGYSGKALAVKLGIRSNDVVVTLDEPDGFRNWLQPLPEGVSMRKTIGRGPEVVVAFARRRDDLSRHIAEAADAIYPNGSIWAAWPKRSAGISTDITEDVVRELALPLGLVDNKVCAISESWSGLRLVWRKELRGQRDG